MRHFLKFRSSHNEYWDRTAVAAQVPDGSGGRFAIGFNVVGSPDQAALEEIAGNIATCSKAELFELYGRIDDPVLSWSRVRLAS